MKNKISQAEKKAKQQTKEFIPSDKVLRIIPHQLGYMFYYFINLRYRYQYYHAHYACYSITDSLYRLHYLVKKDWISKHHLPSMSREKRALHNKNAECYYQSFRMASQISAYSINEPLCAFNILSELLLEDKLTTVSPNLVKNRKTDFCKKLANDNRKLKTFENPFEPNTFTWLFIQQSIELAEKYDQFRKKFWSPFVSARQKLVTEAKKSGGIICPHKDGSKVILPGSKGKVTIPLSQAMGDEK